MEVRKKGGVSTKRKKRGGLRKVEHLCGRIMDKGKSKRTETPNINE